jgi:DNA mismatch repair protein MLH1
MLINIIALIKDPPPLRDLALMAMELKENDWKPTDGPKDELAKKVASLLGSKAEMLNDYFSLEFDEEFNLVGLPLLLGNCQITEVVKTIIY